VVSTGALIAAVLEYGQSSGWRETVCTLKNLSASFRETSKVTKQRTQRPGVKFRHMSN